MGAVVMRYFKAIGKRADAVAKHGVELESEKRAKANALCKEHDAWGVFGYGSRTVGLSFKNSDGVAIPGFLKPFRHRQDGEDFFVYKADKRTKLGRAIVEKLGEINSAPSFNDFALKEFGVSWMAIDPSCRTGYSSVAGYMSETLLFKIPFGGTGNGDRKGPDIPDDLVEITSGEFLQLTEIKE